MFLNSLVIYLSLEFFKNITDILARASLFKRLFLDKIYFMIQFIQLFHKFSLSYWGIHDMTGHR